MQLPHTVLLNNGIAMPRIGLGTCKVRDADAYNAVCAALLSGIRHIDTASIYKNEAEVGRAVRDSGVARSEVFVTSKVSPYQQGTVKAREACEASLNALGLEYIDLMLVHWPGVSKIKGDQVAVRDLRLQTWQVLEDFNKAGKIKSIGVSNFTVHHLKHLLEHCSIMPAVDQVEAHPRFQQTALREFCSSAGIRVTAYASLGSGALLSDPRVVAVSDRERMSPASTLLLWGLQHDCCVIPKSVSPARIEEYSPTQLLQLSLTESAMSELDAMDDGHKFCWDPSSVTV